MIYLKYLLGAIAAMVTSWVAAILAVLFIGSFLTWVLQRPESWYTNSWLVVGLFVAPAIMAHLIVHAWIKSRFYKVGAMHYV